MLSNPPSLRYCGLTIVLANPSRFDDVALLKGSGGWMFNTLCLEANGIDPSSCDIRLAQDSRPILAGTLCILLLGQGCLDTYGVSDDMAFTINTVRGYLIKTKLCPNIPTILSYLPQEAVDVFDHEQKQNPLLAGEEDDSDDEDYVASSIGETAILQKSKHGKTSRNNWSFWLRKDTAKIIKILKNGGKIPQLSAVEPVYRLYPEATEIINFLLNTKNEYLYIDIETDENLNVRCIGLNASSSNIVYMVPFFTFDYRCAYSFRILALFARALVIAFRDNIVVAHNGAAFDFVVLAMKYRIPIGPRVYDTMLAQHRIHAEIEKSLGHLISLYLYEPYHKDEGIYNPNNMHQERSLWTYCGKDVWTMRLIREQQDKISRVDKGLQDSIEQVNASIRPYLITSLLGIRYDSQKLEKQIKENDRLMEQYNRFVKLLIGHKSMQQIQGGSKKNMPGSNKQCVKYFHEMLLYKVVGRSKKTNNPSLGAKNMYKLKLLYDNPVIDFVLAYRQTQTETGHLSFEPWELNV